MKRTSFFRCCVAGIYLSVAATAFSAPPNKPQFEYLAYPDVMYTDSEGNMSICLVNYGGSGDVSHDGVSGDQTVVYVPVGTSGSDLVSMTGITCESQSPAWIGEVDEVSSSDYILLTFRPNGTYTVNNGDVICFNMNSLYVNTETGLSFLNIDQQMHSSAQQPVNNAIGVFKMTMDMAEAVELDPTVEESVKDGVSFDELSGTAVDAQIPDDITVNHAQNADEAAHAANADNATNADEAAHAVNADNATLAATANNANNAVQATNALNANRALSADLATRALSADNANMAFQATRALQADSAANALSADNANYANMANYALSAGDADSVDGMDAAALEESGEILAHAADADAHHSKTTSFSELTDTIADDQLPDDLSVNQADNADTVDGKHAVQLQVPVGSIIAWHKDLAATVTLPTEWVECNGQILSDAESPYNGSTIPDLNGQALFLRGGAASGTTEADTMRYHGHKVNIGTSASGSHNHSASTYIGYGGSHRHSIHTHSMGASTSGVEGGTAGSGGTAYTNYVENHNHNASTSISATGNHAHSVNGNTGATGGAETRPKNMSVVWIMRVK